jgi:hypothetical protein
VSNQEAEWLKDDSGVQDCISQSKLYMIGQRKEAKFVFDNAMVRKSFCLGKSNFNFVVGDESSEFALDFKEIIESRGIEPFSECIEFELGPKMIRIWLYDKNGERKDVIAWFTTEKLLFDKSRGRKGLYGLDDYKKFTNYILHYVGISKKGDSLTRLVIKPHDKRLRILSNEQSFDKLSRLTDEMVLFFFRIEPLEFSSCSFDEAEKIEEMLAGPKFDDVAIVADAEKAFVKILKTEYNALKYENYPKGEDGLYRFGLDRYGYVIGEDISFVTGSGTIKGAFSTYVAIPSDEADLIFIEGEKVEIVRKDK